MLEHSLVDQIHSVKDTSNKISDTNIDINMLKVIYINEKFGTIYSLGIPSLWSNHTLPKTALFGIAKNGRVKRMF